MKHLTLSAAALAAAACVNTLSVGAQLRWRTHERLAGNGAWRLHLALITPVWLLFVCSLPAVRRNPRLGIRRRRRLGLTVVGAAAVLWLAAARQLGGARVLNGDAFGVVAARRVVSGPYRWRPNPIYDSYALALAGCGLFTGSSGYFVLSLESLIFLNVIEAAVEARAFERGPTSQRVIPSAARWVAGAAGRRLRRQ